MRPVPIDPFLNAGSLRELYATLDWDATPLGAPATWSPALRNAVRLALNTRFPVALMWGPEFVLVYNEAYVEMIAEKHPGALGRPSREVFPEAWDVIGPMLQGVLDGTGPTWVEDALLPLQRSGFLEECYFTFSYSPVHGEHGRIEGVLDIAAETTSRVIVGRRLQLLSRLAADLADVEHVGEVPARALALLRTATRDLADVDIRLPGAPAGPANPRLPDGPATPLVSDTVLEQTPHGLVAWVPLTSGTSPGEAVLVVRLSEQLAPDDDYLDFLGLIAGSLDQTLGRVAVREAERRLSETLQRSLLTQPPASGELEVAVRYQSAAELAQVGGDWYDAFYLPDGSLTMVVGDVAGHDHDAAASMGQLRNLLRGVAYTLQQPPAAVLTGLDLAMHGLAVNVFATAILAQVHDEGDAAGLTLRWSNAGHPPPVLIGADGRARLLETTPNLLLGLEASTVRVDHALVLEPGATLVIYTDGLLERRGVPLQESLDWLVAEVDGRHELSAEDLCDHLLGQIAGRAEDDVVLLVFRSATA